MLRKVLLSAGILVLCLLGCVALVDTSRPMPVINYAVAEGRSDKLVILLPGVWDDVKSFEKAGFVEAAKIQGVPFDMLAVDAQLPYYIDGVFFIDCRKM